jgi:hypothetical protein
MSTTTHNPSGSKPSLVPTKIENSAMDELVKSMYELKLQLAKLEEKGQVSTKPTLKPKLD